MRVGFSLSPGGLLLPYHLGVLDSLTHSGRLTDQSPIAGSSAGAIATAVHACRLDSKRILDATIDISDRCHEMGGARGRLMPLLREKMDHFIGPDQVQVLQQREGITAIAYREVFPRNQPILQTQFESKQDLINAVCHSSAFPFFASNWPFALDTSVGRIPRLYLDGFFTVPRDRFGCPDFNEIQMLGENESPTKIVDRTVAISCFPKTVIGLDASAPEDCISPNDTSEENVKRLFRLATQSSSAKELIDLYDAGWQDAEEWCRAQERLIESDHLETYVLGAVVKEK